MNDRQLAHQSMGDKTGEKRSVFPDAREVADAILLRLQQALEGDPVGDYQAGIISRYFKLQLRKDKTLDTKENRELIELLDSRSPRLVDDNLPDPFERVELPLDERVDGFFVYAYELAEASDLSDESRQLIVDGLNATKSRFKVDEE